MGERTVADTHNDSFRMPLREPRSEPVSNLTAGRRTVIQSSSHRLPHCGPGYGQAGSRSACMFMHRSVLG